ncbi:MAG: hypothetical protein F7C38_06340 [Desulfurococcales archaeon]|nr:hypothetical protein [Desulfurococcales archaeon]
MSVTIKPRRDKDISYMGGGMKKRAAKDAGASEEPSLTPTTAHRLAVQGTIILIDIDAMEEVMMERGWNEYKPNEATGLLSNLVEDLVRRRHAVVIHGLDWERGTEEALLELPVTRPEEIENDLVEIAKLMCSQAGVSVTIVAVEGPVGLKPVDRKRVYTGSRGYAKRLLEALKRRGGGVVYVGGRVVYVSPCRRR